MQAASPLPSLAGPEEAGDSLYTRMGHSGAWRGTVGTGQLFGSGRGGGAAELGLGVGGALCSSNLGSF